MRWTAPWIIALLLSVTAVRADDSALSKTEFTFEADGFVGTLFEPEDLGPQVGVIVLGGSEGGTPQHRARSIAEAGYPALGLAYFGEQGLPARLDEVPLEPPLRAIEWMHDEVLSHDRRVVVLGASKGAELALLLSSLEPKVSGVVAYAPSHVVFQGIPENFFPPRSSWKHEGEPVPFVPYKYNAEFNPAAAQPDFLALYRETLTQEEAVDRAGIEVEHIHGPVLLFSGKRDRMWPSTRMGNRIIDRLEAHGHPYPHKHRVYEEAGHVIHEQAGEWSTQLGGTAKANKEAGQDALRRTLKLLTKFKREPPNRPEKREAQCPPPPHRLPGLRQGSARLA